MSGTNPKYSDHDVFIDIFGDRPANLQLLPNLVTLTGSLPLQLILRIVRTSGAILFDNPPYEEDGSVNSGVRGAIDQFRLWRVPMNQKELLNRGAYPKLGCFTAVIDSAVPNSTLYRLVNSCSENEAPFIDDLLPLLIEQIESLGWCYVPLSDEYPLAVILARPTETAWINSLQSSLDNARIPYTSIRRKNAAVSWTLPSEIRVACNLQTGLQ